MVKKRGIDVSAWQGEVDWETVKSKVDFVIVRLGYGNNTIDKQAKRNIAELNRLSIPYGVYWFSYAYTVEMARNEAKSAIAYLKELDANLSYPVYFDWEYDSRRYASQMGVNINNQLLRDMATAFCEEVKSAGYYPGIYANPDYINSHFGKDIFDKYDLWLAHYATSTSYDARVWQYSSKGSIPGINGNVDMNLCMVDYPAIIKNGKADEEPEEESKKGENTVNIELTVLKNGANGEQVEALQRILSTMDYDLGKLNPFDGDFSAKTDAAVRAFQRDNGLTVDGVVGEKTWSKLLGV